tara:strand:- start:3658 stop:4278 length:621 start_codon:yes stop_codon:yes gene_type:complete
MLFSFRNIQEKYNMDIKGIIHIGAHRGQEISDYIDGGIQDIILFEPLTANFEILAGNLAEMNANISGHQVALGNEEKRVTMYLSSNEQMSSSILRPMKHIQNHPTVLFEGTEEVDMMRLDSYSDETEEFNFINMDVQGYELEVLKGGTETLKHIDYVYCEVNRDEVYENNAYVEELDEYLANYDMDRVETVWSGGIWGDALYIRRK